MSVTAKKFLAKYNQTADDIDIGLSLQYLSEDIEAGLKGERSSLDMIPTYLTPDLKVVKHQKNIVIDAGGTNFRSAIAYFDDDNNCLITDLKKTIMPGVSRELSKDKFYSEIAYNIKHLLKKGDNIGFCFSYSVNMGPDIDGTANIFSKEMKVPTVVGTKVGQCTLDAVKKYDSRPRKIAILNDTVATLLGGKGQTLNGNYSSYIGYIYGTGTNISYIEQNKNITKASNLDQSGTMVINTECGGFDRFKRGLFDRIVDDNSVTPHDQSAEKMTSGRYLSAVIFQALLKGVDDGIFCGEVVINPDKLIDTATISQFLSEPDNQSNRLYCCFFDPRDRQLVREIAIELIERAAKIGAIMNAACLLKCGQGTDKDKPVAIVCEGTTFFKLYGYKKTFEEYLTKILNPRGRYYEIIFGKDLNLVGTAMAALVL